METGAAGWPTPGAKSPAPCRPAVRPREGLYPARRELARHRERFARVRGRYPILMPVCDRPEYLSRVLDGLVKMHGVDETTVIFSQDERNEEVSRLIGALPLEKIHLKHTQPFFERFSLFELKSHFNPWGWAISRERWASIRKDWSFTAWDGNMEYCIMEKYGLLNYRPYMSHVDCIGNHGVNMSRSDDCKFYRTFPSTRPIDFFEAHPVLTDAFPIAYQREQNSYERVLDSEHKSEWDRKLVPIVWDQCKKYITPARLRVLRGKMPWL